MCKLGDIIVIKQFKNEVGEKVKKHSFVVVSDDKNTIEGLEYDFISNMLCSFHNEEHKRKKLRFQENFYINKNMIIGKKKLNNKDGFIKADQLYYFNKDNIDYDIIGKLNYKYQCNLLQLIEILKNNGKLNKIVENLKHYVLK